MASSLAGTTYALLPRVCTLLLWQIQRSTWRDHKMYSKIAIDLIFGYRVLCDAYVCTTTTPHRSPSCIQDARNIADPRSTHKAQHSIIVAPIYSRRESGSALPSLVSCDRTVIPSTGVPEQNTWQPHPILGNPGAFRWYVANGDGSLIFQQRGMPFGALYKYLI